MIKSEDLNKWKTSIDRNTQAITIKRLIGGLRSFGSNEFDLNAKESKTIEDAIVLLEQAAEMLKKAAKQKLAEEKRIIKRMEEAKKLINNSPFFALESIADRVALIAMQKPHMVDWLRDESKYQLSSYEYNFKTVLEEMAMTIAHQSDPLNEQLEKAWYKFQDKLPAMKQKHAAYILRLQELQAQAVAKP